MNEFFIFFMFLGTGVLIVSVICDEMKKESEKNKEDIYRMLEMHEAKFEKMALQLLKEKGKENDLG